MICSAVKYFLGILSCLLLLILTQKVDQLWGGRSISSLGLEHCAHASGVMALGFANHNLFTGVIESVTACRATDIQPVIGLGIRLNDGLLSL
jgi:hypothetical protein